MNTLAFYAILYLAVSCAAGLFLGRFIAYAGGNPADNSDLEG